MSKQLALSIVFCVLTMSAFALTMSPGNSRVGQGSEYKDGAIASAPAPSFFSVLLK